VPHFSQNRHHTPVGFYAYIYIFKNCCAATDQKPDIEMGKYRAEWKNQQQFQALNRHEK